MPKISVITPTIRPEGLSVVRNSLINQTLKDFEWLVDINCTGKHDLNASYNRLIKRAKGDIIVSLQDYIKIQPDALENILDLHKNNLNTFITYPVGKVKDWESEPKWDWRIHKQAQMDWRMWEIDFGSCQKDNLYTIGGFDEELDGHWSMDNVNVGLRAELAGFKFLHEPNIRGIAYDHDAFIEHPFRKDYEPIYCNERMDDFRMGLKINYL